MITTCECVSDRGKAGSGYRHAEIIVAICGILDITTLDQELVIVIITTTATVGGGVVIVRAGSSRVV